MRIQDEEMTLSIVSYPLRIIFLVVLFCTFLSTLVNKLKNHRGFLNSFLFRLFVANMEKLIIDVNDLINIFSLVI